MLCLRSKNLVYVPIPKIASTSYTHIFRDVLGWEPDQFDRIDWSNDKVFAHIMDPIVRHAKGTTQCLRKHSILDIVEDPRFQKILATCVFDLHSYPIVNCFGIDNCHKIDWIPIDYSDVDGGQLTNKFLKYHGVDVDVTVYPALNLSIGVTASYTRKKIVELQKTHDVENTLSYFYDQDIVLYNKIIAGIQPDADTWDQISWLNHELS